MSMNLIRTALETRLGTLSPAWDTFWENVEGDPLNASNNRYQIATVLFAQSFGYFGLNSGIKWQGQFLININIKSNIGVKAAEDRAAEIMSHFYKGLSLTSGGVTVQLDQPYPGAASSEADWFSLPVWIPWFCYTNT